MASTLLDQIKFRCEFNDQAIGCEDTMPVRALMKSYTNAVVDTVDKIVETIGTLLLNCGKVRLMLLMFRWRNKMVADVRRRL